MHFAGPSYRISCIIGIPQRVCAHATEMYHICSNKRPRLTNSLRVDACLFKYFCKDQPLHKDNSRPSWLLEMGIWLIILWLTINQKLMGGR